ncbi:MAG: NADH-quinone oxidoreductase subunit NuoE [Bacteroidales bacterium]|nr:NADH-quinone oxidoreductase subunit NuoE [Bacteroidales bacterium]
MTQGTKNILDKYANADRDSLIPILQEIQDNEGWLSEEALTSIGNHLNMPVSKVYGVATFYNQFRFQPQGQYHIQVCRGTACHVLGSATVLDEIKKKLKIEVGETTKDGLFSLEIVACIGTCGLAPVININGNFHAGVTVQSLDEIIESYKEKVSI